MELTVKYINGTSDNIMHSAGLEVSKFYKIKVEKYVEQGRYDLIIKPINYGEEHDTLYNYEQFLMDFEF